MLTIHDCIAMSGLTEVEVLAIAEHEHLPDIVAAELGRHLLDTAHGKEIESWILDGIRSAQSRGDADRAANRTAAAGEFFQAHL